MTIRVSLHHKTSYRYDRLVNLSPHTIRLRPAPHCRTPIQGYSLKIEPADHFLNWQQDPQSNFLARAVFPKKTDRFVVEVDLIADMTVINPFDFFLEPDAEFVPFKYDKSLNHELSPFLEEIKPGPLFAEFLKTVPRERARTSDYLVTLNQMIQERVKYLIRLEPGVQTCEETLGKGSGSCRDSAWLLVQTLRHLGLAARFVSGYLIQLVPDEKPLDGPAGPPADFTDLHAWTEVYLPGAGWVGLDPTSGLFAGEGHIPLAATPDPQSAAPISGGVDDCEVDFQFEMEVRRIHEDPRVTKPYTDDQWADIQDLGERIDLDLQEDGVCLTMGGEPTFVSIDDMDGAEWNTAAMGPRKRALAGSLIRRLRNKFAPGGMLHFGQGKWYPGESLPRWALSVYWRVDGEPVWRNDHLIPQDDADYGHDLKTAREFMRRFAKRLGVNPDNAMPAYEDVWYYLWKEQRLPTNVDPFDSKLDDVEERVRLARIFSKGLNEATGYVMPLGKGIYGYDSEWISGAWKLRGGRLVLLPGDSPIGLRLPLDSLPYAPPSARFAMEVADPMVPKPPLPRAEALQQRLMSPEAESVRESIQEQEIPESPKKGGDSFGTVRTAMCVQPRDGVLSVFLPPVRRLEDYLELITAIEDVALEMRTPVSIEGYTPPPDSRLRELKVTPDPGVIEVNIHPASSWQELVHTTTTLYEEARQSRLGTEKFMLDGRHTGTGGGNHLVIGGPTPGQSPFLRRPDLLRSLIGYWLNHPSLSYLLSGMFVGPTSQAPRVDEARSDAVYELEIAFRQVPEDGSILPWLVDRIFRHLLVDVTGNTHRAEFCIDKLYSPDGPTGRLGLVEFRNFEMPPHARMSLTQALLMRALIARFWRQPYRAPLVRWGTELHDRFMLPHFVAADFRDVIRETRDAGYPLEFEWFAPHFEFRFPVHGRVTHQGLEVELRQAIEPWNVLGEEAMASGTTRFVDSSVERMQVLVRGMRDERHVVTCNGRRLPLRPTGVAGEYVAGVRYRAWQPPSCLHPTIPVHTPLIFDVADTWNNRSIGGCAYHVGHPGGRNYTTFPVNAFEAEARRGARFLGHGHTPGSMTPGPPEPNAEFPCTLDLRR